jgi:hypothetical protein
VETHFSQVTTIYHVPSSGLNTGGLAFCREGIGAGAETPVRSQFFNPKTVTRISEPAVEIISPQVCTVCDTQDLGLESCDESIRSSSA